jgi:hypothetical protein
VPGRPIASAPQMMSALIDGELVAWNAPDDPNPARLRVEGRDVVAVFPDGDVQSFSLSDVAELMVKVAPGWPRAVLVGHHERVLLNFRIARTHGQLGFALGDC